MAIPDHALARIARFGAEGVPKAPWWEAIWETDGEARFMHVLVSFERQSQALNQRGLGGMLRDHGRSGSDELTSMIWPLRGRRPPKVIGTAEA